jgi:hypothetical protein
VKYYQAHIMEPDGHEMYIESSPAFTTQEQARDWIAACMWAVELDMAEKVLFESIQGKDPAPFRSPYYEEYEWAFIIGTPDDWVSDVMNIDAASVFITTLDTEQDEEERNQ